MLVLRVILLIGIQFFINNLENSTPPDIKNIIIPKNYNTFQNNTFLLSCEFLLYSKQKIFEQTFYNTTINNNLISNNTNLLIDASMMANKLGSENVTVNGEYTKKNCTKLSFISNTDKVILSITPYIVNQN